MPDRLKVTHDVTVKISCPLLGLHWFLWVYQSSPTGWLMHFWQSHVQDSKLRPASLSSVIPKPQESPEAFYAQDWLFASTAPSLQVSVLTFRL